MLILINQPDAIEIGTARVKIAVEYSYTDTLNTETWLDANFAVVMTTSSATIDDNPDSKVHGVNMGPNWVLSAPDGPHVGPMNLAIRESRHHDDSRVSGDTGFKKEMPHFVIKGVYLITSLVICKRKEITYTQMLSFNLSC